MAKYPPLEKNAPILLCDDFGTIRRILRVFLTQLGYTNIDEIDSVDWAISRMEESSYKLLVLDSVVGGVKWQEATARVRGNPNSQVSKIPLMIVATADDRPIEPQFYAIGVDGVYFKPGGADQLKAALDRIFG